MSKEYGKGKWWVEHIQSYRAMKNAFRAQGTGTEENHLVHRVFFDNGPPHTRWLANEVPCITLSVQEHRGAQTSYHKLKDGHTVGHGKNAFAGCGMDGYLISRRIRVKGTFSEAEVLKAIEACADYWKMIHMDHCAEALMEFKARYFPKS